jgi:hypothetical protein
MSTWLTGHGHEFKDDPDVSPLKQLIKETCPETARRLPEMFWHATGRDALEIFRNALDPLEKDPAVWPAKLPMAELYFRQQRSRPRGTRAGTSTKISMAAAYRKDGFTMKAIATKMSVTEARVSQWLKAHASESVAREVHTGQHIVGLLD